jgi:CRISPR system Cascade subunit CasC
MSPIVEMHVIQSLQPNNLNRDDTGSPKSTVFGGVTRRRVSSQSFKRAQRVYIREHDLIGGADLGVRTKRLVDDVAARLVSLGKNEEDAEAVARVALLASGFGVDKGTRKSKYLVFASGVEIELLAQEASDRFDVLVSVAADVDTKDAAKKKLPAEIRDAFEGIFRAGKAVDVALFGRMLADLPEGNVEAASSVAHALSTHAVDEEWDYFTAVDDLKPEDTAGADMIGSVGYSSCCLYRYQSVDVARLTANLDGDAELGRRSMRALLEAVVHALPTGKQTTFASPNPPSTVMAVVRISGGESLANAFLKPVRGSESSASLEELSLTGMADYWSRVRTMYGEADIARVRVATLFPESAGQLKGNVVPSLADLIEGTVGDL